MESVVRHASFLIQAFAITGVKEELSLACDVFIFLSSSLRMCIHLMEGTADPFPCVCALKLLYVCVHPHHVWASPSLSELQPEATVDPWPGINNSNIPEPPPPPPPPPPLLPPPIPPPPGRASEWPAYSLPSLCLQLASIVSTGIVWLLLAYSASNGLQSLALCNILVGCHCFQMASILLLWIWLPSAGWCWLVTQIVSRKYIMWGPIHSVLQQLIKRPCHLLFAAIFCKERHLIAPEQYECTQWKVSSHTSCE